MARARLGARTDGSRSDMTRGRIITATAQVIREQGFVGATTSAIAERAEVNQSVIFYHFGSLNQLFATTLEVSSAHRLDAYRAGLDGLSGLGPVLTRTMELVAEDHASGHVSVLVELVAGASAIEALRPSLIEHVERWIAFVEEIVEASLDGTGLAAALPSPRTLALVIISTYLGGEILSGLAPELAAGAALSTVAERIASLASITLGEAHRR